MATISQFTEAGGHHFPGYITERDAVATDAGLTVGRASDDETVWSTWRGSEEQFRATGLFAAGFRFKNSRNFHHNCIKFAHMKLKGDRIALTFADERPVSFGPLAGQPGLERLSYPGNAECANRYGFYGAIEDIRGLGGVDPKMCLLPARPGTRPAYTKSEYDRPNGRWWECLRMPNGKVLLKIQEERPERRTTAVKEMTKEEREARLTAIMQNLRPLNDLLPLLTEEGERTVRMLLALSADQYGLIARVIEQILLREQGGKVQYTSPHLRLVVDNDANSVPPAR